MEAEEFEKRVQEELDKPREINPKQGVYWTEEPATEEQKAAIFAIARKKHIELTEKDVPHDMTKGAARALQYDLLKAPFGANLPGNPDVTRELWDTLNYKDRDAVLREQGDSIQKPCYRGLMEVRNQLKRAIEEELDASSPYNEVAAKMTVYKLPTFSTAIHSIANDESTHAEILKIIVDVITERCGE